MIEAHTDGRFYELSDMVKAGSGDCKGCSACCQGMGESIVLDPYDVFQLQNATEKTFEELLQKEIALSMKDGMILPVIRMDRKKDCCSFLQEGRCSVHQYRPGLCRLFPLGRNFENGKLNYILLKDTCQRPMVKVKVSRFIGVDNIAQYNTFVTDWHYFAKTMKELLSTMPAEQAKTCNMYLLNMFFVKEYSEEIDFYQQFTTRLQYIQKSIN